MIIDEKDYLAHYGILRRSGRYPWGSGGNAEQNVARSFLDYIQELKSQGLTDPEIAKGMDISTTMFRDLRSIAKAEQKAADITMVVRLKDKQMSNVAIGERMGKPESTVRALLKQSETYTEDIIQSTARALKAEVDEHGFIDIGTGVEQFMNISDTKLRTAITLLEQQDGYVHHTVPVKQLGTGEDTKVKVLAQPDTTWGEVMKNRDKIRLPIAYTEDGGETFDTPLPPLHIDPRRVAVTYAEDGGDKADGVIYVRPGVEDVSLGDSTYAQVRVAVGDKNYLKGMALYKDDLPTGVDLMFNTNKSSTGNDLDAMKKLDLTNPDNPFENSTIRRQVVKKLEDGTRQLVSVMNIVNYEGSWGDWSKTIASQVLSKQDRNVAKRQLEVTYAERAEQLEEILSLTNPVIRRKLLSEFADSTDSASVELKAAALPRMGWHVILPVNSIKPNQIYAPNYKDGEQVVLIRYPHGGRFEIPELTVNNNHPESKRLLGNAPDAVGIHSSVAEWLSGADFDGDTVLVIPNDAGKIKHAPALEGLKDFDPKKRYPEYPGMKVMSNTQTEMGMISNLITDMTIKRASNSELAAAVRHSMVVIDAEKHHLNYKQSALDNNIRSLKAKYQTQDDGSSGASTIISRAKSREYVDDRKLRRASEGGPIDPKTGAKVFVPTGKVDNRSGAPKRQLSTRLAEADDAHTLSSGTPIERVYADHANKLKAIANRARLELLKTPSLKYSPSAKRAYATEVASLDAKLALAIRNRPLERQAQVIGNAVVKMKRDAKPNMDYDEIKKIQYQALDAARNRTGAKAQDIKITTREWEAIQAGAISDSKLSQIIDKADMEIVRELATPRSTTLMSPAKTARAQAMLESGAYTRAEIAAQLGVALSTLDRATVGEEWE